MFLCRFDDDRLGVVQAGVVRDVSAALDCLPACRYPLPRTDLLIAHLGDVRKRIDALLDGAPSIALDRVRLLSPVANPGKVVAAPVNYARHLDEARADAQIHHQNQVADIHRAGLFLKANSSVIGPSRPIAIAHPERRTDHEAEIVAVIGKSGRNIPASRAHEYIAGYCAGLDMTIRGPEERSLRKSIDTFTVLGPWLATPDEIPDPAKLGFALMVNGQPRQRANTRDLVIPIPDLIALASSFYTLEPGDVLFSGTPEGVGPVSPGDRIRMTVDHIGDMEVEVGRA